MNQSLDLLDRLSHSASRIEITLTNALIALSSWLSPIPSAALVARATVHHIGWEPGLGLIAGVIVEILGLATTSTTLSLWGYNLARRKTHPPAPVKLAAVFAGVYFLVTLLLTLIMEIVPSLAVLAPALFPILALVGTLNLALRLQHKHRLATIAAEQADRKAERQALRNSRLGASSLGAVSGTTNDQSQIPSQAILQAGKRAKREAKMEALMEALHTDPACGITELGRRIGVSRQTIYAYLQALEQAGRIRHNGNGIEILPDAANAIEASNPEV